MVGGTYILLQKEEEEGEEELDTLQGMASAVLVRSGVGLLS